MKIYHITPKYLKAEMWEGSPLNGERMAIHVCRPNTGLSHRQKYEAIAKWLRGHGVAAPMYKRKG